MFAEGAARHDVEPGVAVDVRQLHVAVVGGVEKVGSERGRHVGHHAVHVHEQHVAEAAGIGEGDLANDDDVGVAVLVDVAGGDVLFLYVVDSDFGIRHDSGARLVDERDPVPGERGAGQQQRAGEQERSERVRRRLRGPAEKADLRRETLGRSGTG